MKITILNKLELKPSIVILIIFFAIAITAYIYFPKSVQKIIPLPIINQEQTTQQEDYLTLPFEIDQIDTADGIFSPFGVYRKTGDQIGYGHDGINIPLLAGANIYAAHDGKIQQLDKMDDGRPGYKLKIIFDDSKDESWGFFYEHVTPLDDIKVGSKVKAGQLIGKTALGKYSNNHFQLSYWFSNYSYSKNAKCWIEKLNPNDNQKFMSFFNTQSKTVQFIQKWETAAEENKLTYKGLLDKTKYPNGPQICYPIGTDGRLSL